MKHYREKIWEEKLIPFEVIQSIVEGDAHACKKVLAEFEGYIAEVCTRKSFDNNHVSFEKVDNTMRDYIEQKLLYALVYHYRILPQEA